MVFIKMNEQIARRRMLWFVFARLFSVNSLPDFFFNILLHVFIKFHLERFAIFFAVYICLMFHDENRSLKRILTITVSFKV